MCTRRWPGAGRYNSEMQHLPSAHGTGVPVGNHKRKEQRYCHSVRSAAASLRKPRRPGAPGEALGGATRAHEQRGNCSQGDSKSQRPEEEEAWLF